jgi:tetratricopeptide (TPR) repeat protein
VKSSERRSCSDCGFNSRSKSAIRNPQPAISPGRIVVAVACLALLAGGVWAAAGLDLDVSRQLFRTGQYAKCLEDAQKAVKQGAYDGQWRVLQAEALMALGRYDEAAEFIDAILTHSRPDIRLMNLAHTVYLQAGRAEQAQTVLGFVYRIVSYRRVEYLSGPEMVAVGESLLQLGAEPRIVLDSFYDRALKADPNCREAYLAAGALAIAKQDYQLAADRYREALKRFGDDPDAHCGLAQAFYPSDRQAMVKSLDAAVHVNPRHAPSLILLAEHQIDAEDFAAAGKSLDRVTAVNPWHPDAWAYRAVLAHLANEPNAVAGHRAKALKFWSNNPRVDYLIGRKLSQEYRFADGAGYQRQALKFDPNYLPAKIQLAQDLLRLGEETEGWALADEVNRRDPYNVEAYNLVNLRDTLTKFQMLPAEGFQVRMDPHEAAIYGDRVVKLLQEARVKLCEKYGLRLDDPVTVELFPSQQDFAVRTFGIPSVDGFLGVCFGKVVTANSPKASVPANWRSMLWHELCHVVTLNLTGNQMPRWLSEGISVYEERQHSPAWGQRMTPEYRRMILDGQLKPLGRLSAAFMSPATPKDLQFAYYESSLAVEFLVERFGFASLRAILADLATGRNINAAIEAHAGPLQKIEADFAAFARQQAQSLAPGADWEQPAREQLDPSDPQAVTEWLRKHPNSFWALSLHAGNLVAEHKWEQAKEPLQKLIALYPQCVEKGNAYRLLAEAYRNLGETAQETQTLSTLATLSGEAPDAYDRLMEIGVEQKNWALVAENAERYLAVNPLLGGTYGRLGRACEELGQDETAIASYERLLLLDPADPVDAHYRLARLLQKRDPAGAKKHILEALADAPRFREGHQLLLKILADSGPTPTLEKKR